MSCVLVQLVLIGEFSGEHSIDEKHCFAGFRMGASYWVQRFWQFSVHHVVGLPNMLGKKILNPFFGIRVNALPKAIAVAEIGIASDGWCFAANQY